MDRITKVKKSAGTVTVCCKMPHGMLLRMFQQIDRVEPVLGGGMRTFQINEAVGEPVHILGNAVGFGVVPRYQIVGGYAMTSNVNRDFFERWMDQNKEHPAVKAGLIWAATDQHEAIDAAEDNAGRRSGLEPLDPEKHGVRNVTPNDLGAPGSVKKAA